jgi:hypothetical protein
MGDVLGGLFAALVAGWLLFGPTVLIALSRRVQGISKVLWLTVAVTPLLLAVLGVVIATKVYPESPLHIHSTHFPAAFFFSIAGAWVVYIAFRRRYVDDLAPNTTPHTHARTSSVDQPPSARAGGRGR